MGRQFSPQVGAILANIPQTMGGFHVPMLAFAGALNAQNGTADAGSDPYTSSSGGFFVANAISYSTPNIGGISATVMNARPDTQNKGEGSLASASGSFGGVNVNASYHTLTASTSGWSLGGNTAVGGLKVGLNYISTKATSTTSDVNTVTAGVAYPVTDAVSLGVNYAVNDAATKASLVNVNAAYTLSKSTQLYVFYSDANAQSFASYSTLQKAGSKGGTQYGVGLAVNF